MNYKIAVTQKEYDEIMVSLSNITLFTTLAKIEYETHLSGTKVKKAEINQFLKRILSDTNAIQRSINTLATIQTGFAEDYALELYECITLLAGFDLKHLNEFTEGIRAIQLENQS